MKVRGLISVICGLVLAGASVSRADKAAVAPPAGATLLLRLVADGVQIYTCEAKESRSEWVFKSPEATLFDTSGRQTGTHFAGPSWRLADGSVVVGEVAARQDALEAGAIPWLLLRAKSHDGAGILANTTVIRRIETKGGAAPKTGCDAAHVADQARMRYSAVYEFYATEE
jgi:hypothetical protein